MVSSEPSLDVAAANVWVRKLREWWMVLVAAVVVIALGVACVLVGRHLSSVHEQQKADTDAVQTASDEVLGLITLDPAHIKAELAALKARTTGDFRQQFDGILATFANTVASENITAKGKIVDAGLSSLTPTTATVVVASTTKVTHKGATTPQTRNYRMSIDLSLVGANWLITGMKFVA